MKFHRCLMQKYLTLYLIIALSVKLYSQIQEEKEVFLTLTNPTNAGFFAVLHSVLGALDFYEKGNYAGIKVNLNEGIYLDSEKGENWWEYFFEPIHLGQEETKKYTFSLYEVLSLATSGFCLSRERGFELIQNYVHLKPEIQQEVDDFVNKYYKGYFVIGVHHRGTDKKLETPLVPYERTLAVLNYFIENFPLETRKRIKIYVATDEQEFLTYLLNFYPSLIIYNSFKRSVNGLPIHYGQNLYLSNYQKGKEALLDCLLLSKSNLLLHSGTSSLSLAAIKFNPYVPAYITRQSF